MAKGGDRSGAAAPAEGGPSDDAGAVAPAAGEQLVSRPCPCVHGLGVGGMWLGVLDTVDYFITPMA